MKPKRFCKILDSEKYGQILVRLDTNDEGDPCVTITVNACDMYVSSILSGFKDDVTDERLLEVLDSLNLEQCEPFAKKITEMLSESGF